MLATLVIGLREGLEAALIVGIIAAFLKRNGHSLKAMWGGVAVAVLLSVGVGVGLEAISASLPQAQQEGMETVIGAIAIVFVTSMIVWMNRHARGMKRELEASATAALKNGTALALAGMAFLAVLKEGFETSVFLLATFQSSTSTVAAAAGAVLGILLAIGIGVGIYVGGIKLNLSRFFRITGIFLVFVAAGLVISMLRTAHEAGWLNIGQQPTLDLSWLAPNGSIQAALITGVLGMPSDPRVIELLGWVAYLVPVLLLTVWPQAWRPGPQHAHILRVGIASGLAVGALALAVAVPLPTTVPVPERAALSAGGYATIASPGSSPVLTLHRDSVKSVAFSGAGLQTTHAGVTAREWSAPAGTDVQNRPSSLTLDQLAALEGGRLPVGVNGNTNPGPFTAVWHSAGTVSLWTANGGLLDARSTPKIVLTLSGGGLPTARTISVASQENAFEVASDYVSRVSAAAAVRASALDEALLWKLYVPLAALAAAAAVAISAVRSRRTVRTPPVVSDVPAATGGSLPTRSSTYAAK